MSDFLQDSQSFHWSPIFHQLQPPDDLGFLGQIQIILSQKSQYHNWSSSSSLNNSPPPPPLLACACSFKVAFPPLKKAYKQILKLKGQFGQVAKKKLRQVLCKDKVSSLLQFIFCLLQIDKKIQGFLDEYFDKMQSIIDLQEKVEKKQLLLKITDIMKYQCNKTGHTDSEFNTVHELWSLAKRKRKQKGSKKERRNRITKDIEYRNIKTRSSRGTQQQDLKRFKQRKQNGEKLRKEINRRQKFDEIDAEQIKENVKIAFAKISHLPTTE